MLSKHCFSLLVLVLMFAPKGEAQTLVNANYPGATYTAFSGINNKGVIIGTWSPQGLTPYTAFTLSNGVYTAIPHNPAGDGTGEQTSLINDNGDFVGVFYAPGVGAQGFLYRGGVYTTIAPLGSFAPTGAYGINNADQVVGYYNDSSGTAHGTLFSNGTYQTIDFPGASDTFLYGINNFGQIVGQFIDSSGNYHGFQYNAGAFVQLDYPGATNTFVLSNNDNGAIFGTSDAGPFIYQNGQFTPFTLTPPGPDTAISVLASNSSGQIVGTSYAPDSGVYFGNGFVLSTGPYAYVPVFSGTINIFDVSFDLPTASIPLAGGPFASAVSPNGSYIYVSSWQSGQVSAISATTDTVTATIPVAANPGGVAFTPDGSTVYVTGSAVDAIDVATNTVKASIPVGVDTSFLAVTPDGKYVYASGSNTVFVISVAANSVIANVPVGNAPGVPAVSPDATSVYVPCAGADLVYVINTASNTVTRTIAITGSPYGLSISPDGSTGYVAEYYGAATAVVNLASGTVMATIPNGTIPIGSAVTPDGAFVWQANLNSNYVALISAATNSVVTTLPVNGGVYDLAISPAPATSQTITQPLSPTAPNTFNFGPHNFTVQYPPGTSFSGVNMTVTAVQTAQQTFKQRVAGTSFANATCIVYSGVGGNCVDYQVTCSSTSGGTITCPSVSTPSITVKTSFDTQQQIINPGFLTTPIGTNEWTNIFESFYLQRIDPTVKGRTKGFSEFVAVDLGATNGQGAGTLNILDPLKSTDARIFPVGTMIPVQFTLSSLADPATAVTDATAGLSLVQISDANGNATANIILDVPKAFCFMGGKYSHFLRTRGYAPGTYALTIYGNAFVAQQVQFTLPVSTKGAALVTTLQSLTLNAGSTAYQAVFTVQNTGTAPANGVIVSSSDLNRSETVTPLPLGLGDIAAGSSTTTVLYPLSAGKPGSTGRITICESYAGGSSGAGVRVLLP